MPGTEKWSPDLDNLLLSAIIFPLRR